jgi:uncharacterized protein YecE (DUF72 family)
MPTPILCGTSSWADRSLVRDGGFYPRKTMKAAERLAYYCARLPLAEIATTFRFPPTPDLCRQWAQRTPDGFVFDLRAWSLLTGSPTLPDSLWTDLADHVRPSSRPSRRLYPSHLPPEVLDECWTRFRHCLEPLRSAGKLGVVILQYPSWFGPRPETCEELIAARERLGGLELAVELRNPAWFDGPRCDETLELLEEHGLGFVCVDGPDSGPRAAPAVVAATSDIAVVRFSGRRNVEAEPWTSPYRYHDDELRGWLGRLEDLAGSTREVHVIMDNCWRGDATDAALSMIQLLDGRSAAGSSQPGGSLQVYECATPSLAVAIQGGLI